jgi:hypothetical protein
MFNLMGRWRRKEKRVGMQGRIGIITIIILMHVEVICPVVCGMMTVLPFFNRIALHLGVIVLVWLNLHDTWHGPLAHFYPLLILNQILLLLTLPPNCSQSVSTNNN